MNNIETKQIDIIEHGVMLSEYFHGTSGVMLPLYITPETKIKEAFDMLKEEINNVWDHIEYVSEYHKYKGDIEHDIICELGKIEKYIKDNKKGEELVCPDMEYQEDEFIENPVLIFSIEFS